MKTMTDLFPTGQAVPKSAVRQWLVGPVANVQGLGADATGSQDSSGALAAARDAVNGAGAVFVPPGVYRLDGDVTLPEGVGLIVSPGATFVIGAGRTLTIHGPLDAGRHQIFAGAGLVAGTLAGAAAIPQWFGARPGIDSTAYLAKCLSCFARVHFPLGTYLVTAALPLLRHAHLTGEGQPNGYIDWTADWEKAAPSYEGRASVIQYAGGVHGALFAAKDDVHFQDLVLRCGQARTTADRFMASHASHVTLTNCKFENLGTIISDDSLGNSFGAIVAKFCKFIGGDLFKGPLVDCVMQGNTFTSCGVCFQLENGSGLNVITGNRFEWNKIAVQAYRSRANVISGNLFDAHEHAAIKLHQTGHQHVSGNVFWRNGRNGVDPGKRSHLHIVEASPGNLVQGNTFLRGAPDGSNAGTWPRYVVELQNAASTVNIFQGNDTAEGCSEMPVSVPAWDSQDALLVDDWHLKGVGSPNEAGDALNEILKRISHAAAGPVRVHLYESRKFTNYTDLAPGGRVVLVGHGNVVLTDAGGQCADLLGLEGLTCSGLAFATPAANFAAPSPPATGSWRRGTVVWNSEPAPGGAAGWICATGGGPSTAVWKPFMASS